MTAALRLAAALAACATAVPAAPAHAVPAVQRLVVLERSHKVFAQPDRSSPRLATVDGRRPITRVRTVLPVLAARTGADGREWVDVRLPGRPNGRSGWILRRRTRTAQTPWRLRVRLSTRTVTAYRAGRAIRRIRAVVGKPSTPTPRGRFFVEENVRLGSAAAGEPFALALSARSDVYSEFDGGPGQTALHGTGNIGGVPGTAASHGCVRLGRRAISWLAARIGPGVPVRIIA